ncbi:MAG: nucleotidyl transferase AbiEii/AbiGii toxin family protein [Candidatus Pacebacteria bacterium]|nr:nucleotidyl transferase AbiEii/AbiGii toxin family protein [Candidatus Paceibacterota bacterium]MBT3511952.1 nucleotidyl transferase AbiEii/AbiGii toxin family protein [Candidatus Paceibacterota bacterium]MBT4005274.1 nucleotidyl transferase AbiEii/AbiGii toxin family protein [Candidatus Paceibacterota bacterium]MBT4358994.1 nucleotidyl transferase AbiEii/AbiGii toxin family protein [Candidatus Paceibacterota bacterium]MBT6898630.1 nucleotidyl transferase AbiEii/AbiGii toxin family protein [
MSHFSENTISDKQKELLLLLADTKLGKLTGGTALALQIGHRLSYDLDFVTDKKITSLNTSILKKKLKSYNLTQLLETDTQYTAFADDIKITLFQDPIPTTHNSVFFKNAELVSIQDIFATKLYILGKRATWRDYCDIAICLDQEIVTLKEGINEATQRYSIAERWILEPMIYFDDIEMMPVEWIKKEYSEKQIKEILQTAVNNYLQ